MKAISTFLGITPSVAIVMAVSLIATSLQAASQRGHRVNRSKAEVSAHRAALEAKRQARTLPVEADIPWLAKLGAQYDGLQIATDLVPTMRGGNIVHIAAHRRGAGASKSLVIFLHGVLSNHGTWRHSAGALGQDHDLWLIDMPGCGASGKPRPDSIESDGYSPTAIGERVLQALRDTFASADCHGNDYQSVTFAAHSLGGMAVIRMFSHPDLRKRYSEVLDRVDRLVLVAPSDVVIQAEMPVFRQIVDLKDWQAWLGARLGAVRKAAKESTRTGHVNRQCALERKAIDLERVLSNIRTRKAAQAMIRQGVPWDHKLRKPEWKGIQELNSHYANIDKPMLIVWGDRDEILPVSMGHKLQAEIRGAELVRFTDANHSVHAEKPAEFATLLREFERASTVAGMDELPNSRVYPNYAGRAIQIASQP